MMSLEPGQLWRCRGGGLWRILHKNADGNWVAASEQPGCEAVRVTFRDDGRVFDQSGEISGPSAMDLDVLVENQGRAMTDGKRLELAAKAAGVGWKWFGATFCIDKDTEMGTYQPWNPLEDDGQALRLAVGLGLSEALTLSVGRGGVTVEFDSSDACAVEFHEHHSDDHLAATRRAIVRAAAAIGGAVEAQKGETE